MSLMDAPVYDDRRARRNQALLIGTLSLLGLLIVLTLLGYILGHGWFFSNLPAEHKVSEFYSALEAKNYAKAYGIYENDPNWQQHPDKYSGYPLSRFTEDWTKYSPVDGPITSHHIDVSKTDGTGPFGSGIIVASTVNGKRGIDVYVSRADGSITYPSPHIIEY
jgi:hypothetical protein